MGTIGGWSALSSSLLVISCVGASPSDRRLALGLESCAGVSSAQLLAKIEHARDDYDLEVLYASSRQFLVECPEHAAADDVRYQLALQLISENLLSSGSIEAKEARDLLDEHQRRAANPEARFDAALLWLKFPEPDVSASALNDRAHQLLERYPSPSDRRQVRYWIIEELLRRNALSSASEHARELLEEEPGIEERDRYEEIIRRSTLLGRDVPLSAAETAALTGVRGKVVIYDFWASWCAPCIAEIPKLRAFYAEHKPRGLEIVGVNVGAADVSLEKQQAKKLGIPWKLLWSSMEDSGLAKRCGVTDLPTYLLVDPEGKIVATELRGPPLYAEALRLLDPHAPGDVSTSE